MTERQKIVVHISSRFRDNPDLLSVRWEYYTGQIEDFYVISRAHLVDAGRQARTALGALAEALLKNPELPEQDIGRLLWKVVNAGRSLYTELFSHPAEGIPAEYPDQSGELARKWRETFEKKIERQSGKFSIQFRAPSDVHVPFGLIYTPLLPAFPSGEYPTTFNSYNGFWCIQYLASVVHTRLGPIDWPPKLQATRTALVSIFDQEERTAAETNTGLTWSPPVECTSPDQFVQALEGAQGLDKVLYFYCHGSGDKLSLKKHSHEHIITEKEFRRWVERDPESLVLAIMNGCSTATNHEAGSWLRATSSPPMRGFIGTEAPVPSLFAWRFGIALLRELLIGGVSIEDALLSLREQHWPLGLLYGAYCFPELQIEPGGNFGLPEAPIERHSNIGTGWIE